MTGGLFWRSLGVQGAVVGVVFAVLLALPLPDGFFEDYGFAAGPAAWLACSLVTARVLALPPGLVAVAALAGGVAGTILLVLAGHWAGMIAALLVFAASCAGYEAGTGERTAAGDAATRQH